MFIEDNISKYNVTRQKYNCEPQFGNLWVRRSGIFGTRVKNIFIN